MKPHRAAGDGAEGTGQSSACCAETSGRTARAARVEGGEQIGKRVGCVWGTVVTAGAADGIRGLGGDLANQAPFACSGRVREDCSGTAD